MSEFATYSPEGLHQYLDAFAGEVDDGLYQAGITDGVKFARGFSTRDCTGESEIKFVASRHRDVFGQVTRHLYHVEEIMTDKVPAFPQEVYDAFDEPVATNLQHWVEDRKTFDFDSTDGAINRRHARVYGIEDIDMLGGLVVGTRELFGRDTSLLGEGLDTRVISNHHGLFVCETALLLPEDGSETSDAFSDITAALELETESVDDHVDALMDLIERLRFKKTGSELPNS